MSLAMSRPFKHPTTGVYYLRKRVPHDLVPVVGRREEKISLNTKNPVEAKRLHLAALADLEARWANLRAGPVTLSEREAHEIAFELYDRWIEMHRDEPSAQTRWRTDLFEKLWFPPTAADIAHPLDEPDWNGVKRAEMEALAFEGADLLLQRRGIRVDDVGRMKLARAVAAVLQQASLVLSRQARGEIGETFSRPVSDGNKTTVAPANARVRLSFEDAIKLWIAEKRPRERTIYEWRRTLAELASFIGHSDAHRLSVDDLLRWKNALLEAKRSTKTIRDAKIAPVRAVFQCAVNNRRLPENPAEKITISVKVSATEARRDFTDAEAALVLKAALNENDPVLRWAP